jgi:hypothetical protein
MSEAISGAVPHNIIPHVAALMRATVLSHPSSTREDAMRKFIIERDIPKVGTFEREQLRGAAAKSNEVLRQLGPDIQWVESYVADDKTFCVYLAKDEAIIHRHAEISGFPATKITEVRKMIDPTTAS